MIEERLVHREEEWVFEQSLVLLALFPQGWKLLPFKQLYWREHPAVWSDTQTQDQNAGMLWRHWDYFTAISSTFACFQRKWGSNLEYYTKWLIETLFSMCFSGVNNIQPSLTVSIQWKSPEKEHKKENPEAWTFSQTYHFV